MKYIDAESLRKEIERRIKSTLNISHIPCHRREELEGLLSFVISLQQEQPEVDLEKEIKEWVDLMVGASFPEQDGDFISEEDYRSVIRQTAIHFLGLNARKEE